MKTILKFVASLLIGITVGFIIATAIIALFTDVTLHEFIDKLSAADAYKSGLIGALIGIVAFIFSLFILITAHEAGHLVCGLLSGYRFISFRIFNLTFIRIDGKLRLKRFAVEGTGGQCLMLPPDLPVEKIPTALYNAGGLIANILLLLVVLPFFFCNLSPEAIEFLLIFCLTDIILILLNGIPMKLGGIGNDAYNMLFLRKNPSTKRAFALQLRINAMIQGGMRPREMPAEWFECDNDVDYRNPIEVSVPIMHASRLIDEMKWEDAYREFDNLYAHRDLLMPLLVNEIACEMAFCAMLTGRKEIAEKLLDAKLRKYIMSYSKVMSSKCRILCGIKLILDNNAPEAQAIYRNLNAGKDRYLLRGEVISDLDIMNHILPEITTNTTTPKMNLKYTPENITHLEPDEIFVFGSNLQGIHAGGAARVAHRNFGAIMGQGVGIQGQSYAIPTMQGGVDTIRPYVDQFIELAREWDQNTFYVTRIGCGIAGFTDEEIAPLFDKAYDLYNVRLPESFARIIARNRKENQK